MPALEAPAVEEEEEAADPLAEDLPPMPVALAAVFNEDPEGVAEAQVISIEDMLATENIERRKELPAHMRCAAHTLNLVATADAENALIDVLFKSVFKNAMEKCRALWNHQSRSTQTADMIKIDLGRRLVVPNATRWNSLFDAVVVLNKMLVEKRKDVYFLTTRFNLI